ncbi:winged helix-turn-helix domain-containing protein [Enterobacter ludwigii]|uniref:winged helix-turn-helix domain-containing protein n=1 Tax=Enterobacter ludwigii TaxID=299767 RepID=UPI00273FC36F|nr:winged helix-turn-helix domain-containing protein [Enterobacter ludwigii]MDP5163574.1 winged helix-turn-helix domain-containing protein [Enterobacter ludwigii]
MQAIINGKVEYDSEEYILKSIDSPENYIRLQPITCLVLTELLLRNGSVISREELLENIWVGRGYSPSNASLNNNIAAIRKSYSTLTGEELALITIPKQGYEFKCDLDVKQNPSPDLTLHDTSQKIKNPKRIFYSALILLTLAFIIALVYNFSSSAQLTEFKQKKYSKIQSLGSCSFYGYNYSGVLTSAEKDVFTQFSNERCLEKNSGRQDVFVDLNTQNSKYNFLTACKKDLDGEYVRCINYRVTYTAS